VGDGAGRRFELAPRHYVIAAVVVLALGALASAALRRLAEQGAFGGLPLYQVTPGLFGDGSGARDPRTGALRVVGVDESTLASWTRSHGGDGAAKYSRLDQIDRTNVASLEPAWIFDGAAAKLRGDGVWRRNVQANPIVADGLLFAATAQDTLVALDAASGELRWEFVPRAVPARRGLVHWAGEDGVPARLYLIAGAELLALDAATGEPVATFGNGGSVAIGEATAAPAVVGRRVIATTNTPATVRAFDLLTGSELWRTPLMADARPIGAAPWGGFAVDAARNRAYLTTGNPRPPLYGADRPGNNEHANSVVCVDLETGAVVWAWQEVRHDLWNFDIASPPVLTTIEVAGVRADVVAVPTKIGTTLLLERDTGAPIFDQRRRLAAPSVLAGEATAAYQPDPVLPEPFASVEFSKGDVTDIGDANRASVERQIANATFGWFATATIGRPLVVFGQHGGAEWPGAAMNHDTGLLYFPVNHIPWAIRLYMLSREDELPPSPAADLYAERCARCHGAAREGNYDKRGERELAYAPSLVSLTQLPGLERAYELAWFRDRHRGAPELEVSQAELDLLSSSFDALDAELLAREATRITASTAQLVDLEGYPGGAPPWGEIVALHLPTGRIAWRVPFGEYEELRARGIPQTGQPSYGGVIATRGGLVFATGTVDGRIRAFDGADGRELWSYRLEAAGSAPPTTYEIDGRQYVAVVASGGRFHNFRERSSKIYAFALPKSR